MSEHSEQSALMLMVRDDERFRWLYAIPNGGHRIKAVAAQLQREGVKPGVADLNFPFPVCKYHGCYIEMKFGKNKLTESQKEFLEYAESKGYKTAVCYSAEEAYEVLVEYVGGME